MLINPSIFKAYDIRGIYGKEVDIEGWKDVVKGTYTYLARAIGKHSISINVGHDMRTESQALYQITIDTLREAGATVKALGLVSTPHAYFAVLELGSDAAMQITASHNPAGYTGMKFVYREGTRIIKVSGKSVGEIVLKKGFLKATPGESVSQVRAPLEKEVAKTLASLPPITKPFRIVADTANGMGVTYLKALSKILPLDIVYLNSELDGSFPNHLSDTLQHGLWTKLCETVVKEKADFGLATDGDGDRVAFVDERGRFLPCTLITCLIMDVLHQTEHADLFLVDIRSIMNVRQYAKSIGAKIHVTKVGHANITHDMHTTGALFGGESSGHYFFASTGGAENSMRVIASVLYKLQQTGTTISQTLKSYESAYEAVERNFTLPPTLTKDTVFDLLQKAYPDASIDLMDGITLTYPDYRANIRGSNTEPLLRLNLESTSQSLLNEALTRYEKQLVGWGAQPKSGH